MGGVGEWVGGWGMRGGDVGWEGGIRIEGDVGCVEGWGTQHDAGQAMLQKRRNAGRTQ